MRRHSCEPTCSAIYTARLSSRTCEVTCRRLQRGLTSCLAKSHLPAPPSLPRTDWRKERGSRSPEQSGVGHHFGYVPNESGVRRFRDLRVRRHICSLRYPPTNFPEVHVDESHDGIPKSILVNPAPYSLELAGVISM